MKNFLNLILIIVLIGGALFILRPTLTPLESEYLEFKVGAKADAQMKATEEADMFKLKGEIYYSVFSKKPFEADCSIEVIIKNTNDMSKAIFTEELGTKDKMITRPVNPVKSDAIGEYVIYIVKDGRIIARKVFNVVENPPVASAKAVAAPEAPKAPENQKSEEVKTK